MNIDEELYYLSLAAEDKYLKILNTYFNSKFATLTEALDYISTYSISDNKKDLKSQYENGISEEIAVELLRDIEKNMFNIIDVKQAFKSKHGQLKTASDDLARAGFIDEVYTMNVMSNTMNKIISKYNNNRVFLEYKIESMNDKNQDFRLVLNRFEDNNKVRDINGIKYNSGYEQVLKGLIPMENKLHLNKFHIVSGTGKDLLKNGGTEMMMRYIENAINLSIKEQSTIKELNMKELYGSMATDDEIAAGDGEYNFYIANIKGSEYRQLLANIILYNKLVNDLPVFVTTSKGKLNFKLCSEVVRDVSQGRWTMEIDSLNEAYVADFDRNKANKDIASEINDKIIKNINKYQLWYGK